MKTLSAQYIREGDTLRLSDVQLRGDGISAAGNLLVHSLAETDPVVTVEADAAVERGGPVRDSLDVVTKHDQPLDEGAKRRAGREMRLEPGQRRLHAAPPAPMTPNKGPRTGEGMSSGKNP